MVIVADTIFITSWRTGRLDTANEALLGQHAEGVVHRLPRDRAEVRADDFGDIIRRRMRPTSYGAEHRQPLGGHLQAAFPKLSSSQKLGRILGHARDSTTILDFVQNWTVAKILEINRPLDFFFRLGVRSWFVG
jgi:hypothetical protein